MMCSRFTNRFCKAPITNPTREAHEWRAQSEFRRCALVQFVTPHLSSSIGGQASSRDCTKLGRAPISQRLRDPSYHNTGTGQGPNITVGTHSPSYFMDLHCHFPECSFGGSHLPDDSRTKQDLFSARLEFSQARPKLTSKTKRCYNKMSEMLYESRNCWSSLFVCFRPDGNATCLHAPQRPSSFWKARPPLATTLSRSSHRSTQDCE
jgi:hypothetical protein